MRAIDYQLIKSDDLNMSELQHNKAPREHTRLQLILAAEKLFAESGIDGVSLRQINIEAGQKNSSAAHYHFGSKGALILSIYQQRMAHVNARRLATLDILQTAGNEHSVRHIVGAIVHPIVEEIDADASGRNYIRFMAQAIGHPQLDLVALWRQEHTGGLARALKLLQTALPQVPEPIFGQRFGLAFEQIVHSLADREKLRQAEQNSFEIDSALFVNNLIDCIAGAMAAPISPETQREIDRLHQNKS
jgi:AcrR family transcriptional regulator